MNDEQILGEIAYLDRGLEVRPPGGFPSDADSMVALIRDAIQIEMAKQGHLQKAGDVSTRLASLEKRMDAMRREVLRQRGTPSVIYVRHARPTGKVSPEGTANVAQMLRPPRATLPRAMVLFYSLGLISSLAFATLLALSAVGVTVIHPFLSLLGLVGGLGWLTTAWTDLLLWKRERFLGAKTTTE
jgi:hypothetical protein